jgi:hypothetical protein
MDYRSCKDKLKITDLGSPIYIKKDLFFFLQRYYMILKIKCIFAIGQLAHQFVRLRYIRQQI